jgi:hypothetical protein
MASTVMSIRAVCLLAAAVAGLALLAGAAPALPPPATPEPAATVPANEGDGRDEPRRREEVLASSRWRRAMHELDEWLAAQPVYSPDRVQRIKADLTARVASMSSYELEYLLDQLDEKLDVLESDPAREARDWLGRYLAVMADDRRAELLADVPSVLDLSAADLTARLAEVEAKRAAVERAAQASKRSREEFGEFVRAERRWVESERDRLARLHHTRVVFSPYRGEPADDPPFADSYDSPTVVGVGPWNAFFARSLTAF